MKNKTANTPEMTANQQAYGEGSEEIYIATDGGVYYSQKDFSDSGKTLKTQMKRTDSTKQNKEYQAHDLQQHNSGSTLDITSYNVYKGTGANQTKPSEVVVGVAGSGDVNDWTRNFRNTDYSKAGSKTNAELQNEIDNSSGWTWENAKLEQEIRSQVSELNKYRDSGIPIAIVGDSKGGADAAYLALSFVKSTDPAVLPLAGKSDYKDCDFSAVDVYLTNPKGINLSQEDYDILQKMADAGKITIEVVYPEILSNVGGNKLPKEIPYSKKIYTVPNDTDWVENHKVGSYDDNVYNDRNWKFQCTEEPKKGKTGHFVSYTYKVSTATNKDGRTISVTEYYFEEKKSYVQELKTHLDNMVIEQNKYKEEDIVGLFQSEVSTRMSSLKSIHETALKEANSFDEYKSDPSNLDSILGSNSEARDLTKNPENLRAMQSKYDSEVTTQVDSESGSYSSVVTKIVQSDVEIYHAYIDEKMSEIKKFISNTVEATIQDLEKSKQNYLTSQKEIQMEIVRISYP